MVSKSCFSFILLLLQLLANPSLASSNSISYEKIAKLHKRGKYEKVLEQIKLIESNRFGKDGRLKYSYRNDVQYYHFKLSSRILLNKIGSWKESIGLYNRLLILDSTKQFATQEAYHKLNQQIRGLLATSLARNQLDVTRLMVNALARQGDTVSAYRKVYPTLETLPMACKGALAEFLKGYDYTFIDKKALAVKKQATISKQAWELSKDYSYDFEKARAIYIWIVNNIIYDYTYRIYDGETTFKKGTGVCSGFSYLFKLMGEEAGLKINRITGMANNGQKTDHHAWNSIHFGEGTFLLDCTWASCVKEKTDFYYLVTEKELSKTHKAEK